MGEMFASNMWKTKLSLKTLKIATQREFVEVEAMYRNGLITASVWSLWEESKSENKNCLPKLEKQVFHSHAQLLYYFLKVLNKHSFIQQFPDLFSCWN